MSFCNHGWSDTHFFEYECRVWFLRSLSDNFWSLTDIFSQLSDIFQDDHRRHEPKNVFSSSLMFWKKSTDYMWQLSPKSVLFIMTYCLRSESYRHGNKKIHLTKEQHFTKIWNPPNLLHLTRGFLWLLSLFCIWSVLWVLTSVRFNSYLSLMNVYLFFLLKWCYWCCRAVSSMHGHFQVCVL